MVFDDDCPCGARNEAATWKEILVLKEKILRLREVLEILLANWPTHKDGMDYEPMPVGVLNLMTDYLQEVREQTIREVAGLFDIEHPCMAKGHRTGFDGQCWARDKILALLPTNEPKEKV